ncbi:unnamed protein product [Rhizoctonia solani]|uniref:Nephrocystin 3-like N-terminal domain-containing protein n=1 Tax=Rhizoctonia solani TaxID=456999 RepID=A0A8H3CFD3_9AGAM|nr:unnamed protein product [Rhizoctonia solani]
MNFKKIFKREKKKKPASGGPGSQSRADTGSPSPSTSAQSTSPKAVASNILSPPGNNPQFLTSPSSPPKQKNEGTIPSGHTWMSLTVFLKLLDQSGLFTPLAQAVGDLNWFIKAHENIIFMRTDYKALRTQLEGLFEDLCGHFSEGIPLVMTTSMLNLCTAIQVELGRVYGTQDRNVISRYIQANQDLEKIMECYRRIQSHLERVMLNVSLNILRTMDRQTIEVQLGKLNPSMSARHDSAEAHVVQRRDCTANTREQVLLDLQTWKNNLNGENVCWMNGMAGTGKTTIAMTLCSMLCKIHELGASFFCTRLLPSCRDVKLILPTIAYQLARFSSPFRGELLQTMERDPDVHTKVLRVQFEHMILKPLQAVEKSLPPNIVIVIDALEECDDEHGVTQILDVLLEHAAKLPVKFLVSSRPEPHIREKIVRSSQKSRLTLHELDERVVKQDIEIYLRDELSRMTLSEDQLAALIQKAGVLFIYAATAVRYIGAGNFNMDPKKRLKTILGVSGHGSLNKNKEIDALYHAVLTSGLKNPNLEPFEREQMELVLHTVICAQEPLTSAALTGLLQLDDIDQVHAALQPLWSVLHISESDAETRISTFHASFPEYILDSSRSGQFACNAQVHHRRTAELCLVRIQQHKPQFNICSLVTSYMFDEDAITDAEVKMAIPSDLIYACQHWATHLELGGDCELDKQLRVLEEFLSNRLLLWMEIMNLTKRAEKSIEILEKTTSWLRTSNCLEGIQLLAQDARRFATMFATSPLSRSTPHLYVSMLASWPIHRPISRCYGQRARGLVGIKGIQAAERQLGLLSMIPVKCEVYCVAFSPDGTFFAAGTSDNTILVWDALSCRMTIDPIRGHTGSIQSIAISPDGTQICSGSRDCTVCIWDSKNGRQIARPLLGHTRWILTVAYSPDSLWLASGSADGTVRIWHTRNREANGVPFQGRDGQIESVAFSPDSSIIAIASESLIHLWDPWKGQAVREPLNGHTTPVGASFLPNMEQLVSTSKDGNIAIWDIIGGQTTVDPFKAHLLGISTMAVSPDGIFVASGSVDCTVKIWDIRSRKTFSVLWHTNCVESVAFSPDSLRLVSGSQDNSVRVWEVQDSPDQAVESQSDGHSDWVRSVTFSPCGAYIISGSDDTTLRLWNTHNRTPSSSPLRGHHGRILLVRISADGNRIISISDDRTICIWAWESGNLESTIDLADTNDPYPPGYTVQWPVAFSVDGDRVAFGSYSGSIYMWDGRKLSFESTEHSDAVISIAFSHDGRSVASGSRDNKIIIWDVSSRKRLLEPLIGHTGWVFSVEFSPNGSQIASGSGDNTIRLWSSEDGRQQHTPLIGHSGAIQSVAFSPHGTYVVSGSQDRSIRIWHIASRQSIAIFHGHTDIVCSVAFSPNGTQIASGSADMAIRLWDVSAFIDASPKGSIDPARTFRNNTNGIPLFDWEIDEDGWVHDTQHHLLLWVPPDLRSILLRPQNTTLISRQGCIELDFSGARIGKGWTDCYESIA